MPDSYSVTCSNIDATEVLAKKFADLVKDNGAFVCLYGDIGSGKTAFAKLVCKYLDVKQKVTSPSFVILNEYRSGHLPVYHFDLYRLEREGIKTITDELEEYSQGKILTFVEWAEFSQNQLPFDRIEVKIEYIEESVRSFSFKSIGKTNENIILELSKC